jgi:hypothetical protein
MFSKTELCRNLKILFFRPMGLLDFIFFLIILSEPTDQCVIANLQTGFEHILLLHIVKISCKYSELVPSFMKMYPISLTFTPLHSNWAISPRNDLFKKGWLTLVNVFPLISRKFKKIFNTIFFYRKSTMTLFPKKNLEPTTSQFFKVLGSCKNVET